MICDHPTPKSCPRTASGVVVSVVCKWTMNQKPPVLGNCHDCSMRKVLVVKHRCEACRIRKNEKLRKSYIPQSKRPENYCCQCHKVVDKLATKWYCAPCREFRNRKQRERRTGIIEPIPPPIAKCKGCGEVQQLFTKDRCLPCRDKWNAFYREYRRDKRAQAAASGVCENAHCRKPTTEGKPYCRNCRIVNSERTIEWQRKNRRRNADQEATAIPKAKNSGVAGSKRMGRQRDRS